MCWEVGWGVQKWRCGVWGGENVRYSFKTIVPSKVTHLIHSPIGEQSSLAFCLEPQKHRGHQRSPRHPVFFAHTHPRTPSQAHTRTHARARNRHAAWSTARRDGDKREARCPRARPSLSLPRAVTCQLLAQAPPPHLSRSESGRGFSANPGSPLCCNCEEDVKGPTLL